MTIKVSNFHKLLQERSQKGLNLDSPEIKSDSSESVRHVNTRSFTIETPSESRNFSFNQKSFGENRNENRRNFSVNPPRGFSDKKEEKVEEKPVLTKMDFPELEIKEIKSSAVTVRDYKKLLEDVEGLKEGADKMNAEIIEREEKEMNDRIESEISYIQEKEKERRRWDYIKKIKKQYENDYVSYNPDDYLEHEMLYYVDEEELSNDEVLALYEEMLQETKNREIELDNEIYDSEKYYTVYDEESKYYEGDSITF
jgi:hypothetical protein